MRVLCLCQSCSLLLGLLILLVICIQPPIQGWSQQGHTEEDVFLLPINSSSKSLANLEFDIKNDKKTDPEEHLGETESLGEANSLPASSPPPSSSAGKTWESSKETMILSPQTQHELNPQPHAEPQCNISVQRLMLTSLLVRWGRQLGFQCDLLLFSTNNHGRAFFSAAYNRVVSPLVIEHLGVSGAQQEFRLCVGCGWSRTRRSGHFRHSQASSASSATFSFIPSSSASDTHNSLQGESLNFCCLDFSLEELRGEHGWRMNRKPIESTLVACFMTLVIIVWSVAALIWPVPIIAGFLPNGMEQRRTSSK
ncbi:transmembrane protein 158 [Discoglossus pictus]